MNAPVYTLNIFSLSLLQFLPASPKGRSNHPCLDPNPQAADVYAF